MLQITPRERHALQLLARNTAVGEIASCLGVSARDVEVELNVLFARLGVSNRTEAIDRALRRGLLMLDEDTRSPVTTAAG